MPVRLLFALALALAALPLRAQPEVVPAEHPVYGFLLAQRVAGRLPAYRHEALPLDRAAVRRHLDALDAQEGGSATYWLAEFRREFFEPAERIEQVIGGPGGLRLPRGRDTEKFLFFFRDADWRVALSATGRAQGRVAEDTASYDGLALVPEGRIEGNYRGLVGFYSSTFDGLQVTGDTRVLLADPDLTPLYYVSRDPTNVPGSFDRSTASLRMGRGPFSAEIAHERLRIGASPDQPLVLAEGADYFSFVRLALDTRVVQYQFVHGALGDRSFTPEGTNVLVGPERYLALHRIALNPTRWLGLGFTEMVVYGLRGPELAYLNPLYPIKPAEHAQWDRDNALFALDATIRPLRGVEAYGTFLADDLDFDRLGQQSFNNKWAAQTGVSAALPFLSGLGFVEYTRIGPFVYTHRFFAEGSFYNSYQHNGFGLGHPLGPNADQVAAGVQVWLPFRARARATARYARRAENFVDSTGALVNVGGDVRDGRQPNFDVFENVFLRGDRYEGPGLRLDVTWEPVRDIGVRLFGDLQRWDRAPDPFFFRGEVYVSF